MQTVTTIGLDIAKAVFQVHGIDVEGKVVIRRSLDKDAPFHRAIQRLGAITSQPVLGGLHHQYCRI
jgi:transposase